MKNKLMFFIMSLFLVSLVSAMSISKSININSCQTLDEEGESYYLTQDIQTDDTCFIITKDSITLNLNGHKITGDNIGQDYAIKLDGVSNAVVINGFIEGFSGMNSAGIYLKDTKFSDVSDISVSDSAIGFLLESSETNKIENSEVIDIHKISGRTAGIILSDSDNNSIINVKSNLTDDYSLDLPVAVIIEGGNDNLIKSLDIYGENYFLGIWFAESYSHNISKDNILQKINFKGSLMPIEFIETGVIFFDADSSSDTLIEKSDLRTENENSVSMYHGAHTAKMITSLYSSVYVNKDSTLETTNLTSSLNTLRCFK